ncbi:MULTISPECIES: lipid A export permease/ATP-binding protein MsbA [Azospira]|uniref:Lipid A export permease/ATP-binding protein MsbA n=1 Tax=Azospira oryzae (strain ATCC BAA-33 / DSM 13638 / PS) TaxID=640081 RepID=G8QPM5_AZOOP|nr:MULTISPECIES: lipid A export permease/ATP-binding protein MsbA [Azospira]AEV24881.1 lipid A export permease/ATP-binding protein MsbA [Azospira oryzae PS]MDK9691988.1 lipid A export permease/ATP-binding protein MsbA [Azospira sp.]
MSRQDLNTRALYFRLLGYVRPYWKAVALSLGATAILAATEPLFPALMKPLLDDGFIKSGSFGNPIWIPLGIVGVFILRSIFSYFSSYGFSWVSNRVVTDIRDEMYQRLVRLPIAYFQKHGSSVPLTKIAYDVNGVAVAATNVVVTILRDGLSVVGLLGWLLWLNWQLTLVCFALIPAIAWSMRTFSWRMRRASRGSQEAVARMVEALQETSHCARVIKVFGGEAQEAGRFGQINNEVRRQGMRQAVASSATSPITHIFASIALAIVVYVALTQSASGSTSVGSFVSFITALLMLLAPLRRLADVSAPLQRGLASAESVFQLLDEAPEADPGQTRLGRAEGRITLEQVTFRYPGAERDALAGVSLDIAPGQTVALVGQSGGGKSTLAALVPRFYNPDSGCLRLDGHDLQELSLESLRRNIAYVSQDVLLFNDTVAANIAYGATADASREQIEAAAEAAHALDFIRALPEGFDTVIGENGNRLSGGQRQRLAIARALLKDAPVLILDEATSALDNESERAVQAALETLMQNRTTLVIAHRLSTIESADKIVVLAQGAIVEQGTHAELLAREGAYASLYRLQFAEVA